MSIYATLWRLKFPQFGEDHTGCEWIDVTAQGVPAHIGTPSPGFGYETGDPYSDFLPPPIEILSEEDEQKLRAVVFVTAGTRKGTNRCGQEYVDPLLVISGADYDGLSFDALHGRICDALRGDRPRCIMEMWKPDGSVNLSFENGSSRELDGS